MSPVSSIVVSRLTSPSVTQVIVGLSILYINEFVKEYFGPVLHSGLSMLINTTLSKVMGVKETQIMTAEDLEKVKEAEKAVLIKEKYKSPADDKKASKGSENDIYMLTTHGYQKHRFLSKAFVKRNKLAEADDR
jgi:hypothetical protein